jgi:serine/threonine-protein kinase
VTAPKKRFWSSLAPFAIGLALCQGARAENGADREAAAEALFQEARGLMAQGRVAEACPKFAESNRIDPGIGVLFFLADCYERNGQTASAWTTFRSAGAAAKAANQPDRERQASERTAALENRLSKIAVVVPESAQVPGLQVRWDDAPLERPLWGSPLPVDPGPHRLFVSAPGRQTHEREVRIEPGPSASTIELFELRPLPDSKPIAPQQPAISPRPAQPVNDARPVGRRPLGAQRVAAIGLGGAGLVGVGIGSFFGLKTISTWQDAKSHCRGTGEPLQCDQRGIELRDSAHSSGTISTIAFSLGGAALAAGAVLWFTAPQADAQERTASTWIGWASAGRGATLSAGRTF